MPTRADLAKIHIAKKELGLGERTYRDLLRTRYERVSSVDLSPSQVRDLIDYFRRLGWRPHPGKTPLRSATRAQRRMILALWWDIAETGGLRHPERNSLDHFIEHLTGKPGLGDLRVRDAIKVIEALKRWYDRVHED